MAKRVFTVLAIDGGGVRGIIPARFLEEIEERTGKPIAELFDLIGATSTGSIIASGLTVPNPKDPKKPKFTAKDILALYHKDAVDIFPEIQFRNLRHLLPGASGFYDPEPLEKSLKATLGDAKVKDALTSLMIPATEIKKYKPTWIHHFKGKKDVEGWGSMLLRDAVRATTAAPTLIPTKYLYTHPNEDNPKAKERHAFIDGSIFAGTICRKLHTAAKKLAPPDAEIVIVHIGTSYNKMSFSPDEFNKFSPLGLVSKSNGSVIINMTTDMVTLDINNDLKDEIGDLFFSFDKPIDNTTPDAPQGSLDNADPENMKNLEKFAENLIDEMNDDLDKLCGLLKEGVYAEELNTKSKKTMQELVDIMSATNNSKELGQVYNKIVKYSSDLEEAEEIEKGDEKIAELSSQLLEKHMDQLDRIFARLQAKKQYRAKHPKESVFKRWANKLTNPFKSKENGVSNDNEQKNPQNNKRHNNKPPRL